LVDKALLTQIKQAPERAASKLLTLLKGPPEKIAPGVLQTTAVLARRLRELGKHAQALKVAQAGQRRTRALRCEEALAALGTGHHELFFELAEQDRVLAEALRPVLQALRGEAITPGETRLPPWLVAAAEVASAAQRGEPLDPAFFDKDSRIGDRGLRCALMAAYALARGEASPETLALLEARGDKRLTQLAYQEASETAPSLLDEGRLAQLREAPEVIRRALARRIRQNPSAADLAQYLATVGHAHLDPPARGLGALLEAFGLLQNPGQALAALLVAERAGVDPLETLRCRWLLHSQEHPPWEEDAMTLLSRLGSEAKKHPDGAPLAAEILLRLVTYQAMQGNVEQVTRMAREARTLATSLGEDQDAFEEELSFQELLACKTKDPSRCVTALIDFLRQHPKHVEGWKLRLHLAESLPKKEQDQLWLQAAEATQHEEFRERARLASLRLGKRTPFEGLTSGASFGDLILEFQHLIEVDTSLDPSDLVEEVLRIANLPVEARPRRRILLLALLDAASKVDASMDGQRVIPTLERTLKLAAQDKDEELAGYLIRHALDLEEEETLEAVLVHLQPFPFSPSFLSHVITVLHACGATEEAESIYLSHEAILSNQERKRLETMMNARRSPSLMRQVPPCMLEFAAMEILCQESLYPYRLALYEQEDEDEDEEGEGYDGEGSLDGMYLDGMHQDPNDSMMKTLEEISDLLRFLPHERKKIKNFVSKLPSEKQAILALTFLEILKLGPTQGKPLMKNLFNSLLRGEMP
jgi:hypothetical protein